MINTLSNRESAGGVSRQPPDIAPGIGDLMNRGLVMMQSQLHISPRALADENSEPTQKRKYRKRIVSKHYVPPKTVARNSELQRKRRELQKQRILHQMPPRQAVEASRLKLSTPVADQGRAVKVRLSKPHDQTIEHHQSLPAVRGAEDPTRFPESRDLGATPVKILLTRPIGQTLT